MPSTKRKQEESDDEFEQDLSDYEDNDVEADEEEEEEDAEEAEEQGTARRAGAAVGPSSAGPWQPGRTLRFYCKGAIKLVRLHDFMTYNGTVTIHPGPRLNLVLGPNGTGKSSLVCALCIGLNGSPKTLGRADNLKDFVRRGMHAFWIEITLSAGGEGRDHVVKRIVTLRKERDANGALVTRYESKWQIHGRDVPSKEVDKLVKNLNVQFDNLCQFLPQDKVPEFARMDKYEILAATEKALGDSSLYNQHQLLVQLRKDEKQAAADRDTSSGRLAKLQGDQERQRREFERFQLREKLQEEARALRSQAKWLEVVAKGKAAEAAKKRQEERRAALRALEGQQEEETRPIRAREESVKDIRQAKTAAEREARDADSRMRRLGEKLQKHDNDMCTLADELATLEEQAKGRQAEIALAQQRLASAEAEVAQAPDRPPQELQNRIQELRSSIQTTRREASELEAHRNNLGGQIQGLQAQIGRVRAKQ